MRPDLLEILRCPESGAEVDLVRVDRWFPLVGGGRSSRHVVQGLLRSRGGERRYYPILDEIPRLLPQGLESEEEAAYVASASADLGGADSGNESPGGVDPWGRAERVEPEIVSTEAVEAEIRRRMESQYRLDASTPEGVRRRMEGEIRYMTAELRGGNKAKYVRLAAPRVPAVGTLLETGGNFPGLTRSLARHYRPTRSVVANIQVMFPMAFKTAERDITAVRADVQALPFAPDAFELVASAFMLEHVPDWRAGLRSMLSVGERVLLAFGPNKHFPFEVGHIDAPLAGTLPKPAAAYVAWAWLAATGKRRPLHRIRDILGEVFHVSSRAFEKECRRLGAVPTNLFPEMVQVIIGDDAAPRTGARRWLKRYPWAASAAARTLTALRMEPQIYYLIDAPGS
ncbi:MAG: methyltransferase domain-containing protein [Acidobacteriota bacterium]